MPVHNGGLYLEKAVRSVIDQTFPEWELILVDDGSTDGAVDALTITDPRVRLVRQSHRTAPTASESALQHSRGTFIAILDQDDVWAPTKLARHVAAFARHEETDFNFTWCHYIGPNDEVLPLPRRHWRGRVSFELLVRDFVIGSSSAVAFRRDAARAIGGFDVSLPCMYDLDLILRLATLRADNGIAIEDDLCAYRRHPHQMSRNWRTLETDWKRLLHGWLAQAGLPEEALRHGNANMTRYFSFLAYESRDTASAARLWWQSFREQPRRNLRDPRSWKLAAAISAASLLPASLLRKLETMAVKRAT